MTDKVVGEPRFTTDYPAERIEAHVFFDQLEVFGADSFQAEALADEDQHTVLPGILLLEGCL